MKYRPLGRTGLQVSELGFGCGSVGGILVRGERRAAMRAVARAIELGINYFDTARIYGDGLSETNLGAALKELGADVLVGTKVRLNAREMERIHEAIVESVEGSLRRLGRESVDLIQLHNAIGLCRQPEREWIGLADLEPAIQAFQALQKQGKAQFWGINGLGETEALHRAVTCAGAYTVQSCYNLLNPTSGAKAPPGFPFQDYEQLIDQAANHQVGAIAIRVLAGGALSGMPERHPVAEGSVSPIASGRDYAEDVERSKRFRFLVEDGFAGNLPEAALRFAISKPELSTALIGISSMEQLEQAVTYTAKGPLPVEARRRCEEVWASFVA